MAPAPVPSRGQSAAMLAGLLAVAVAVAVASFAVKANKARSFHLFFGSLFINDDTSPVAVDLASGKPSVRLNNAFKAVSARRTGDVDVVALAGATLMLNPGTGEFNMVDESGFIVKPTGGGVVLPALPGALSASAVPAGDSAYIVRSAPTRAAVYLVNQATVAAAIGPGAKAKARASAAMSHPVVTAPGGRASADGALWVLTGTGDTHTVTRLSVPFGSNAGVTLTAARRGRVHGVAALGSATRNTDGTGDEVMALASNRGFDVYRGNGARTHLPIKPPAGTDRIVPVTNAEGTLSFLYHGDGGWSVVSARADGSGQASVRPIPALGGGLDLVTPAQSGGRLYTTARNGTGALWQIDALGSAQPIAGAATYPHPAQEPLDLQGMQVEARGSRVVFNTRGNFKALVVFSDDSRPPRVIDKHSAVQIDANGAASLGTGSKQKPDKARTPARQQPPRKPTTQRRHTLDNKLSCKTTTQQPHIPAVQLIERGSRSAQLRWTYPLLDPQDCAASTYTIAVKLIDGSNAPPAPASVTVQGTDGVNLTGLFPNSRYQLIVTAYLNGKGTASTPVEFRTSAEGPAAPTGLRTSVDSGGNWTVSWNSCGPVLTGCIPTASWRIIAGFCDGAGLSSPPATRQLPGDPTQHGFSYTYLGGDGLLGRGLSFQVEGVGADGIIGTPSTQGRCLRSWTPPVAANISVQASAPPPTTAQSTTLTIATVHFAAGQDHDLGGVGGHVRYELLSGDSVITTVGPTTDDSVTLSGIRPGRRYQVAVTAIAPGHPNSTARIGPVDVEPAIATWPDPSLSASFQNVSAATGTLSLTVTFPPGTNTRGETFDLVDARLTCGNSNTSKSLSYSNFSAGDTLRFAGISRVDHNSLVGTCRVDGALEQNASHRTDPALYGAGQSSRAGTSVHIDAPTFAGGANDFSASWTSTSPSDPSVRLVYDGSDPLLVQHARDWSEVVTNGSSPRCGAGDAAPPVDITLERACTREGGTFTAGVSFSYFGVPHSLTGIQVNGTAPPPVSYANMSFAASWYPGSSVTRNNAVVVHYADEHTYDQPTVNSLSWSFTVTSDASSGATCASATRPPQIDGGGPNLKVDFAACPAFPDIAATLPATYTLHVTVSDPHFGTRTWDTPVTGELLA